MIKRSICDSFEKNVVHKTHQRNTHIHGDAAGVTTRGVRPHAPVNNTVFFLCHGFINFMYINKILMKTRL